MWIGKSVICKKFPFDAQTSLWPLISREAMMIMIMIMMIILHHYPQHHHRHNFDGIYHGYATSTHLGCSDDDWLICVVGEAVYIWDTSPQISVALDITSFTIRSGWVVWLFCQHEVANSKVALSELPVMLVSIVIISQCEFEGCTIRAVCFVSIVSDCSLIFKVNSQDGADRVLFNVLETILNKKIGQNEWNFFFLRYLRLVCMMNLH